MSTLSVASETHAPLQASTRKRGCLYLILRGLKWLVIAVVAILVLGFAYQAAAVELDKRGFPPPGQLYAVNGHQMHINCTGTGSPTVVLQAGGASDSTWWYWVQKQLSAHTQVCAFDRPGTGWSEPTSEPRDALTMVSELHTLLGMAAIPTPYVMAGHSYGAVLTRIYAAQYPDEVAGMVAVDSAVMIPDHFDSQSEFDQWLAQWQGTHALFGWLTRLGLTRLLDAGQFQNSGYPPEVIAEMTALHARNQTIDTDFAEFVTGYWALTKAAANAENFANLPFAILWARQSMDAYDTHIEGFKAMREKLSTYSSNSVTRVVEGADHGSIIGNEAYAAQVTDAVLAVINAGQTGQPLAQ
ncbi:MAG: alpha/beta hydrolase [Anaerolineae bacterium]